jgi:hypothetical protein
MFKPVLYASREWTSSKDIYDLNTGELVFSDCDDTAGVSYACDLFEFGDYILSHDITGILSVYTKKYVVVSEFNYRVGFNISVSGPRATSAWNAPWADAPVGDAIHYPQSVDKGFIYQNRYFVVVTDKYVIKIDLQVPSAPTASYHQVPTGAINVGVGEDVFSPEFRAPYFLLGNVLYSTKLTASTLQSYYESRFNLDTLTWTYPQANNANQGAIRFSQPVRDIINSNLNRPFPWYPRKMDLSNEYSVGISFIHNRTLDTYSPTSAYPVTIFKTLIPLDTDHIADPTNITVGDQGVVYTGSFTLTVSVNGVTEEVTGNITGPNDLLYPTIVSAINTHSAAPTLSYADCVLNSLGMFNYDTPKSIIVTNGTTGTPFLSVVPDIEIVQVAGIPNAYTSETTGDYYVRFTDNDDTAAYIISTHIPDITQIIKYNTVTGVIAYTKEIPRVFEQRSSADTIEFNRQQYGIFEGIDGQAYFVPNDAWIMKLDRSGRPQVIFATPLDEENVSRTQTFMDVIPDWVVSTTVGTDGAVHANVEVSMYDKISGRFLYRKYSDSRGRVTFSCLDDDPKVLLYHSPVTGKLSKTIEKIPTIRRN